MGYLQDIIIEVPKGSRVKYEYDFEKEKIRVDRIMKTAFVYPYNYGYIEKTIADDGDAVDVLVLCDESFFPLSVIKCKVVGVLYTKDGKDENNLKGDPKIICVPEDEVDEESLLIDDINDISNVKKEIITDFFTNYKNNYKNKVSVVEKWGDKKEAIDIIEKAIVQYKNK